MSEEPFDLARILEQVAPSSLVAHLDADRAYDGQPHTVNGERGQQMVEGLTMRDITDCFVRACYESSGLPIKQWPGSVHDLPDLDLMAVSQNLGCNIEKRMGIYPNVPHVECPTCHEQVTLLMPDECWDCKYRRRASRTENGDR